MSIIRNPEPRKMEIDLNGTQGNAYFLMGTAQRLGKQLDLDVDSIIEDMKSSDYEHLIKVFDKHFGMIIDLVYR
tara:strand:+ start:695 stop:916 length:222 start_codon:yes stop_codon:yes gene_type:complete